MIELPGVIESGMPRKNGQRKPGTTRGSPRRSRTAKALRISRHAVKSQCARGWDGWGRLSDDGSRQHNSDKSEDPWGGGLLHLQGGARSSAHPTQCGTSEFTTRCAKGRHKPNISRCMPGAGLSRSCVGRCCPTCQPSSRIGENPPCGMIGRVEETSASFEARSAPRLYPTERLGVQFPGPTRQNENPSSLGLCQLPPAADITGNAYGSLKPTPTDRLRRAFLHLSYSMMLSHLLDTITPSLSVG